MYERLDSNGAQVGYNEAGCSNNHLLVNSRESNTLTKMTNTNTPGKG